MAHLLPIIEYSRPAEIRETALAHLFHMHVRDVVERPGRILGIAYDERLPLIEGFIPRYIYWVRFKKAGDCAGNHYHAQKAELFYPLAGDMTVDLEDPKTQKKERLALNQQDNTFLYVRIGIAHRVTAKQDNALLLVLASTASAEEDEVPYAVVTGG